MRCSKDGHQALRAAKAQAHKNAASQPVFKPFQALTLELRAQAAIKLGAVRNLRYIPLQAKCLSINRDKKVTRRVPQ
jgi:hypothetical protein